MSEELPESGWDPPARFRFQENEDTGYGEPVEKEGGAGSVDGGRGFVMRIASLSGSLLDEAGICASVRRVAHLDTGKWHGEIDARFPLLEYLRLDVLPASLPARTNRVWVTLEQSVRADPAFARQFLHKLGATENARTIKDWEEEPHPVVCLCSRPVTLHALDTNPSIKLRVKFDPWGKFQEANLSAVVANSGKGVIECARTILTAEVACAALTVPLRMIDPLL
ncbi:hypothetical protein KBB96_03595 [Luteolibacter ambystomatis]|uniref:Uncharacterized protein n=1 Tax=Luteolibacter ambystomatis TaxID=2824561 RepID=A0A975J0Y1_9BACT|nr:hypothetical protein [Luteolibacter ambystomatis]QUE51977.1 hypothetical protein KBB96_03595 [Luteolibacter ambystomatis]